MKSQKAFLMFIKKMGTQQLSLCVVLISKNHVRLIYDKIIGMARMKHRQLLFFKIWFRKDKSFIDDLAAEFERQLKGAELVKLGVAA